MITFIVPTVGRTSLFATLRSIDPWPGDEILVVSDDPSHVPDMPQVRHVLCPKGGDWGHAERNYATQFARGSHIAHIDDDDVYAPGTRALMADALLKATNKPVIFKMQFPNGLTLWQEPVVRCGNLGTPCFLIPNQPSMLGSWGSFVGGDCGFLESSKWSLTEDYVWRPEVIALLGHNV